MKSENLTDMGFTTQAFPAGTHMCMIYTDDTERRAVIGRYLESGIKSLERGAYFADTMQPEEVQDWLLGMGIELPTDDRFSILPADQTYCPGGKFIPENMLNTLRDFYDRAKKAGYPNARVSGEMSWALRGIPGSDRLMEYEALVNEVLLTHPVSAICQYDAGRFDGVTILNVLKVHPMMVVYGQIVHNPYYLKPQDFLKDFRAEHEHVN